MCFTQQWDLQELGTVIPIVSPPYTRKKTRLGHLDLERYPQDVEDFRKGYERRFADAYPDEPPVSSKIDTMKLDNFTQQMPLRKTHSSINPNCSLQLATAGWI